MQVMRGYWTKFSKNKALKFSSSKLNSGNYSFNEFYRTGYRSGNSGWNFIGNPYPSSVNWDQVVTLNGGENFVSQTKLNSAIYVSDHSGGYYSYVDGVGTGGFDGNIPAATAFWVQANMEHIFPESTVANAELRFNNSVRIHKGDDNSLKSAQLPNQNIIRIFVQSDDKSDEAVLKIKAGATSGFEPHYDAAKRFSDNINTPQIALNDVEENKLSIYTVGGFSEQPTSIPVCLRNITDAEYSIRVEFDEERPIFNRSSSPFER